MIEKTKTYKLLERFHNESIGSLRDALAKPDVKNKEILEDRLKFYEELYNVMFRLVFSHTDFVSNVRKFHKDMVKLGVYNTDDDGNSYSNLDIIEDEFHQSYKKIERLNNYYQDCNEALVPTDDALKAIKLFQDAFGTMTIPVE